MKESEGHTRSQNPVKFFYYWSEDIIFLGSIVLTSQWLLVLFYVTSEFHMFLLEPSMGKSKFRFAGNHHKHSFSD